MHAVYATKTLKRQAYRKRRNERFRNEQAALLAADPTHQKAVNPFGIRARKARQKRSEKKRLAQLEQQAESAKSAELAQPPARTIITLKKRANKSRG